MLQIRLKHKFLPRRRAYKHTHRYIVYTHTYFTDQAEGSVGKSQGWKEVESRTCAAAIKDASTTRVAANKVQGSRAAGEGESGEGLRG